MNLRQRFVIGIVLISTVAGEAYDSSSSLVVVVEQMDRPARSLAT